MPAPRKAPIAPGAFALSVHLHPAPHAGRTVRDGAASPGRPDAGRCIVGGVAAPDPRPLNDPPAPNLRRNRFRRALLADLLCGTVVVSVVGFCALSPIWEMDTFWHLMVGRWILENAALPTQNVWSAADPTQPYRAVQWLYELAVAAIDRAWGLEAVRLANAAWVTGTFLTFYAMLRRMLGCSALESLAWTLALLVVFQDRIRVRPHVVSFTIEIVLLFAVLRLPALRPRHALLLLPLFLFWAAVHAGAAWVFLLGLSGLTLASLLWERLDGQRRFAWTLLLGTGAAALG